MNRPAAKQRDLPQYQHPDKQEAVDFIARDVDVEPIIDGMESVDRVDCWQQVVERFDGVDDVTEALRDRRAQLEDELDQQAEFQTASEMDTTADTVEAVTDGGATTVEPDESDWQPRDDQEVVEYEDDAERESKKREAASVAKMFDDAEEIREKIVEERNSDRVRPHVIDALQERLEVVEG